MELRWIKIQLILSIVFFSQINRTECLSLSRKFLRGMALGVLFGRNMFGRHLGGGSPMPPPMASACPMPKPSKCPSKDKHEDKHDPPVQSTFPVYIHNPTYFFKYPPPLLLDDHSLHEFLNENRRLLRILRS